MNYKAFQLEINQQLLLFRDIDVETSYPVVKIYAYYLDKDGDDNMCEENVLFENTESALSYVRDFSEDSAVAWCKKNIISDEE